MRRQRFERLQHQLEAQGVDGLWVAEEGVGGCLERATVRIENGGPSSLTRYGRL